MQTSSKKLSSYQQRKLQQQFVNLLADIKNTTEAKDFFKSFLTETEQSVFIKRLGIVWMLNDGKSYQEIKEKLHVSSATISSIANQMEDSGIKLAIKKIKVDRWAEKLAQKIVSWLPLR